MYLPALMVEDVGFISPTLIHVDSWNQVVGANDSKVESYS